MKPRKATEKIREELKRKREEKKQISAVPVKQEQKKEEKKEQIKKASVSNRSAAQRNTQKITLLGLRNISYKDLDKMKKDSFDPKILITEDDSDDEEYKEIMKKFELNKGEVGSAKNKSKEPFSALTSRATPKNINIPYLLPHNIEVD